jgi:S1-C subfamily serine protease
VTLLDVVLLALFGLSAWGGYRRGALLQVAGLLGLIAGFAIGVWLAPTFADLVESDRAKVAAALGTVLVFGAFGDAVGSVVGVRVRRHARGTRLRAADAAGGAALSVTALILAVWFLALNLASGPFPRLAAALQRSAVVRAVDEVLPPPPALTAQLEAVLDLFGFPDVFAGLPPRPAAPVPQPSDAEAGRAAADARDSVVLISGPACDRILQGTGVVVDDGLVLTNAHVVAGGAPTVEWDGTVFNAVAVGFDEDLDVAVLRVEDLDAPALTLVPEELGRGDGGAVLGYPSSTYVEQSAGVRRALDAVGRDIYGQGQVRRRIYELQVTVRPGNSGGPFVLPGERLAGIVFGAAASEEHVGYALTSPSLIPVVEEAARAGEVGTGRCAD